MTTEVLKNVWYGCALSSDLPLGKMKSLVLAGEPVVLARQTNGQVFALRNICPHRGIPFSFGRVVKDQIECPYHGWKFNSQGICTEIPSLCSDQNLDCSKIKVKNYPIKESHGIIWIYLFDKEKPMSEDLAPQPPELPNFENSAKPQIITQAVFPCHIDHAVIGLMDPAHGPYVHKSWFWRSERSSYEKRKNFAPVNFGFQMVRHQPSKNSKAYKILGGQPTTEITFQIPGCRVEHIQVGQGNVISLTVLSPISDKETQVYSVLYWDRPWLNVVKPLIRAFANRFLFQDYEAVKNQQEGLKYDPSLMLIKDADTQAKWYYQLKTEWLQHASQNREFKNPIMPTQLSWRS
ncbi:MAG: Rieske 2Fe-2S domain-containing protein [Bdellovibrionales bacterium]